MALASATKELEEMSPLLLKEVIFIVGESEWESMSPPQRLEKAKMWKMDAIANMGARAMGEDINIVKAEKPLSALSPAMQQSKSTSFLPSMNLVAQPLVRFEPVQEDREELLIDDAKALGVSPTFLKEVVFIVGESKWAGLSHSQRLEKTKVCRLEAIANMGARAMGDDTNIVRAGKPLRSAMSQSKSTSFVPSMNSFTPKKIDDASAAKQLGEMSQLLLKEVIFIVGESEWAGLSPSQRLEKTYMCRLEATANMAARAMGEEVVKTEKPQLSKSESLSVFNFQKGLGPSTKLESQKASFLPTVFEPAIRSR